MKTVEHHEGASRSPRRWLALSFVMMASVFFLQGAVFFARTFPNFLHSDMAIEVLMGARAIAGKTPVPPDFYNVNGDVWIFGSHWWAALFIPLFGISPTTILGANVLGLLVELAVLTWCFRRLGGSVLAASFGAMVTLFPWSTIQMQFSYVELSYGLLATLCLVPLVVYARALDARPPDRPAHIDLTAASLALFLVSLQNPTRAIICDLAPLVAACLWPWRDKPARSRLRIAGLATAVWFVANVSHRWVLRKHVLFSPMPRGVFVVQGLDGVTRNLELLAKALVALASPREDVAASAIVGFIVLAGAVAVPVRTALSRSRAYDPIRFLGLALLVELALVTGAMVVGNLLSDEKSARYLLPSLLPLLGLACISAVGTAAGALSTSEPRARLAAVWLCLLPMVGALATSRRIVGRREVFAEADPAKQKRVAEELVRRGLRRGFATYWNANVLTVLSNGNAVTCPVEFGESLAASRALVTATCFDKTTLPSQFFIVAGAAEREAATHAMDKTLGAEPVERFSVFGEFDVSVFRTADSSLTWLDAP